MPPHQHGRHASATHTAYKEKNTESIKERKWKRQMSKLMFWLNISSYEN